MQTIDEAARALAAGHTTARRLIERSLERIGEGEGPRAFVHVDAESARTMADSADGLRRVGRAPSPYAGIPFSLKDLMDVAGQPTPAGSVVLANAEPATATAPVVARMMAAGFVPMGRTNMTEFAFSGLGINPHYGTPRAPWDRETGRVPGGSSSGAAVSVADGMVLGALGTDTGGSCRVPAAYCGVTGYKPTARRVPLAGVLPLAPSLDSVGPLAPTVHCCAIIDAILAGEPESAHAPRLPLAGLRFALPDTMMLDDMDPVVAAAFGQALSTLSAAGAIIAHIPFPMAADAAAASARGGFAAAEAFAWHRALLSRDGDRYDPAIRRRIERGGALGAADYIDLLEARRRIIAAADAATAPFDALIMPTTPILPAPIAALEADDREYNRINLLSLRNTTIANFLDRCSISLPMTPADAPPAGLMLLGETMGDHRLFAIARAVEAALGHRRQV